MCKLLNKSRRIRMNQDMFDAFESLLKYGINNESKFIREAIQEKMERDLPKLILEQQRKNQLIECPF